jgi:hypothetical protein
LKGHVGIEGRGENMEEIVWLKLMIPESCMELWTQSCAAQEWI